MIQARMTTKLAWTTTRITRPLGTVQWKSIVVRHLMNGSSRRPLAQAAAAHAIDELPDIPQHVIVDPIEANRAILEKERPHAQRVVDGSSISSFSPHINGMDEYWRGVPFWSDVPTDQFLSYRWQVSNTIDRQDKLVRFLQGVLPEKLSAGPGEVWLRQDFIDDVEKGMEDAPMSVRLTPHILSVIDWKMALRDPIFRQFIPRRSVMKPDSPNLTFDSLHEEHDSPVQGLVHRYPDKVLFLATSVCPVYCRFCTRSYAVGNHTNAVTKASQKPGRKRWEAMFKYIEDHPEVQDVVVSGGDSYYLSPDQLQLIGNRLLEMPNVKRFRFASKGLGVCPSRILDAADRWTEALIDLSHKGRRMGKQVALHTHINHPNEITWVTELAARRLFECGVIVRNQSVLLKCVNDDLATMSKLLRRLADLNITPYYVYQADMVKGTEDLRTPLSTILELEKNLRGTIAGFMMPTFVVDLPGGGGKRLANGFEQYDPNKGVYTWKSPGVAGGEKNFEYYDPTPSHGP